MIQQNDSGGSDYHGNTVGAIKVVPEQENTSPKMRLRRVIREFAHKVVGQGLQIEAQSPVLAEPDTSKQSWSTPGILRMDKRLSRLEIQTRKVSITISLSDVHSFKKGCSMSGTVDTELPVDQATDRDALALTVLQESGADMELLFDSTSTRDQAYTCFKIFHMSVFQSLDSQSLTSSQEMSASTPGDDGRTEMTG